MTQQSPPLPWLEEFGSQHLHEVDSILSSRGGDPNLHGKLLREIDALHGLVQEIRKRLNSCNSFLLLPQEILREIVAIVASEEPPTFTHCGEYDMDHDNSLGWISLSHVCQTLRAVVIGYHALWAEVVTVFPDAQDEFLRRAGRLPLTLKNFQSISQCEHAETRTQFMIQHLHLARHISLKRCCYDQREGIVEDEAVKKMVDQWPCDPAAFSRSNFPHLETLALSFTLDTHHSELVTPDVFHFLPMRSPKLRSVALVNFYIPFYPGTLQSLDLYRTTEHALPTAQQFLDMLGLCTGLKNLSLLSWIPSELAPVTEPHINFSSLETITIVDRTTRTAALRSHVVLPDFTNRHFQFTDITQDEISTEAFLDTVRHHFHAERHCPSIYSLAVSQIVKSADLIFNLKAEITASDREEGSHSQTFVDFTFRFSRATNQRPYFNFKRTVERFITTFDLLKITHLSLLFHGNGQYDAHQWCSLLSPLKNLTGLRLSGSAPTVICSALAVSDSVALLPRLHKIWIDSLGISEETYDPEETSVMTQSKFLQVFTSRKRDGAPIEFVRLERIITAEVKARGTLLLRLRAIVPVVECKLDETLKRQDSDPWNYFGTFPSIWSFIDDL